MPPLRPHRDDLLIAGAGMLGGVLMWWLGLFSVMDFQRGALVLVPLAVMCGAVLLRRTAPGVALGVGLPALAGDLLTGSLLVTVVLFSDLVYAATLYGSPGLSRLMPPAATVFTLSVTLALLLATRRPEALLAGALAAFITMAPAWTGTLVRGHQETARAERLRAEQTALLAEMDRAQALTAERARMARELHDVVANHLSAIAIHSTAALSLGDREPGAARQALGVIRENSTQGLAEMRRLIGLLRDTGADAPVSASPTLSGLGALVAQARESGAADGLRVVLRGDFGASAPAGDIPAPVELAAYRIVQESLTNAVKHAVPGEVSVDVHRADASLTVRVRSPYGRRSGPRAPGSGSGLLGMRERAELLGGEFDAGVVADGRPGVEVWQVRARLPLSRREGADG